MRPIFKTSTYLQQRQPPLQVRWETNVKNGVCAVSFDRKDIEMNKIMVGCLEARFHVFDARTQHPSKVCPLSPFEDACRPHS